MKLLLLQPPIEDFYETDIRLQPIGLCFLKAVVKNKLPEVDVKIIDLHNGYGKKTLAVPSELKYLKEYYVPDQSPFSSFSNYYRFGADDKQIREVIDREAPDMVGISSLFSPYHRSALKVAEIAKQSGCVTLLGGSHVSAMPEFVLKNSAVDFIIEGEGEKPLVLFLQQWLGERDFTRVPNLGFKTDQGLVINARSSNYSLDEIPVPDISDFDIQQYRFEKKPMTFIITSRSCPHHCSFCSVHSTFSNGYSRRRPELVFEEIKQRYAQGIRVFDFEDDNLTFYKQEFKKLLAMIIAEFSEKQKPIQLVAMNGISYISLDEEILAMMKRAGFSHLNLALVSSDNRVRETTKRPHTIDKYLEIIEKARSLDFNIVSYQILGLPGESLGSQMQTLSFNARQPILLGSSLFYMTPNSPIARQLNFNANEKDVFLSRLTAMVDDFPQSLVDRQQIFTLFIITRIFNFIKSLPLVSETSLGLLTEEKQNILPDLGQRFNFGLFLLGRLLREHQLYTGSPEKMVEQKNFLFPIFDEMRHLTPWIKNQRGLKIHLN